MSTIVLTGGGTAGHVIPNIALVPLLKKHFDRIIYFGGNGMETEIAQKNGLPFYQTTVIKFDRRNYLADFKIPFLLWKGIEEADIIFREIKPDIVFSKGGYAALPACFAAKKHDVPVICHESDYTMGLANKIVSRFAKKMLTSFPETKGGVCVGNPVREEFFHPIRTDASLLSSDPSKPTLLVCGGSLGSVALNEVLYRALPTLLKQYNVIHIAGKNGDPSVKYANYSSFVYTDNLPALLRISDVVVCRSGANTLAEVAALGKRCVTVPLPKGSSRGDQLLNAKSYEKRGYCDVLLQENLSVETLLSSLEAVRYKTPPRLDVQAINARIVKEILSVTR